ncbi:MAG: cysteine desulfurase, partial [Vicinamibacteria bacterium]|nr:cysteine desulfurase [Vicinamibacteria bacterium]
MRPGAGEPASVAPAPLDVATIRADFPILATQVHNQPLVYLDSAASAQ